MEVRFEMTSLDKLSYILDMEFVKVKEDMIMHKKKYMNEFLDRLAMINCNTITNSYETNAKFGEFYDEER